MTTVSKLALIIQTVRNFNNVTQAQIIQLTNLHKADASRYCNAAEQSGFLVKIGKKYILGPLCTPN